MSVTVKNDNTPQVLAALKSAIKKSLQECGNLVENEAALRCPVDTGRLRNSLTHKLSGDNKVEIGSDVEYAGYVELGTSKNPRPKKYLRPALEDCISDVGKIFNSNLK